MCNGVVVLLMKLTFWELMIEVREITHTNIF